MCADDHQIYTNDNDVQKATQTLRRQRGGLTVVQGEIITSQSLKIPDPNH